jgi:hypothetical protein
MTRFRPELCIATFILTAAISACSGGASTRGIDPQVHRLDPPRGVQLDIDGGTPDIHCGFTPTGGPRRVLLYEVEPPDALWRYFAQPRWKLIAGCVTGPGEKTMQPVFYSIPRRPRFAARVWLLTAWDSVSHGEWAQMERYSAHVTGATKSFSFGLPKDDTSPPDFVTVTALVVVEHHGPTVSTQAK